MSEDLNKTLVIDEPDPQRIDERKDDPPGSFLDVYRSISSAHIPQDENFVNASVLEGVIPEAVRYGIMTRGNMQAFRGVVKSTQGELFYFNWHDGTQFKLVPADNPTKQWDADRMFKSCRIGCDLIRSNTPLDMPGEESVEADDLDKAGGSLPGAAVAPVPEEEWKEEQERMLHERHPGAAGTQTTDDPTRGRNWHDGQQEVLQRAQDGMPSLAMNDGEKHWNTADLIKSWGQQLQQTAPRVQPQATSLEAEYMQTVMQVPPDQLQKGIRLAPRHRLAFEQRKAQRLRERLSRLSSWAKGNGET